MTKTERVIIPTIDEMNAMPSAELVVLRTRFIDAIEAMEIQRLSHSAHPDTAPTGDWEMRMRSAMIRYRRAVTAVKGILRARAIEYEESARHRVIKAAIAWAKDGYRPETIDALLRAVEALEASGEIEP